MVYARLVSGSQTDDLFTALLNVSFTCFFFLPYFICFLYLLLLSNVCSHVRFPTEFHRKPQEAKRGSAAEWTDVNEAQMNH